MNRFTGRSHGRTTARAAEVAARDTAGSRRQPGRAVWFRRVAAAAAFVIPVAMVATPVTAQAVAPPGNGFVVTAGDLSFILKQIKIAERHSATFTASNPCGTLVGPASDQIPDALTSYGLRTVDGSCNNLFPGREKFAAADQPFPRLAPAKFRDAEPITPSLPVGPARPDELQAEARQQRRHRLRAEDGQQPRRRPDVHQPGRGRGCRRPRAQPAEPGAVPLHHGP